MLLLAIINLTEYTTYLLFGITKFRKIF